MKITQVETFVVKVPINRPIGDATHDFTVWSVPGCWIRTDDGLVGTGYTGLEGSGESLVTSVIAEHYAPRLVGADPHEVNRLWEDLQWGEMHWIGRAGVTQMALAAVDIALWDLRAQAAQLPLWQLLGGHKASFPSYNTDGGWLNWPIEQLVEDTARLVAEGWAGVKIKLGKAELREDLDRLAAVRGHLGPAPLLMADVNMGWDLARARSAAPALAEHDAFWLEEPLHPDDVAAHVELARRTSTPIALGESLYHRFQFRDFIAQGAVGFAQPDVTRVGGITEWMRIAAMANCFSVPVVPHVGDMMQVHQHLVAATPNAPMLEYIPWLLELFVEPVRVERGTVHMPQTPGASTTMREDSLRRWRVA